MNDEKRYVAEWEELGEPYVREQFEKKRFSDFKMRLASHWLAERDRAREESSSAESTVLARSAADAALRQADAAEEANRKADTANTIATAALAIAVIAIAVSIIGLFVG